MLFTLLVALGAGFAVTLIANIATTVFLHRSLSHRALTLSAPVRFVFRVLTWITTGIRPRQWVAVHRKHHAFTDVEGDPHSPVLLGWVRVQMKNVALYRREANNAATVAPLCHRVRPRMHRSTHERGDDFTPIECNIIT